MTPRTGILTRLWRWLFGYTPSCLACVAGQQTAWVIADAYTYCRLGHCLNHCTTLCKCPLPKVAALPGAKEWEP